MFKMLKISLLFVALVGSGLATAQGKIAVLNVEQAVFNTDRAKKDYEELQKRADYSDNKKDFEKLQSELKALQEKFQKDAVAMSAEKRKDEAKKIESGRADLEHLARKLLQAEQELKRKLLAEATPKVRQIVSELIKAEGIGLLLDGKAAMHVDSSYSITAKVTDKLNQSL